MAIRFIPTRKKKKAHSKIIRQRFFLSLGVSLEQTPHNRAAAVRKQT